ncbi:MAG: 3-isopropylmalate dehydratase large subunit [Vicinamibacterales bacterium]
MSSGRTIFDKIWDAHVVRGPGLDAADGIVQPALLYIDLHLVHEVTSPQAFDGLRRRGLGVRRPDLTFATADHSTPTVAGGSAADTAAARQVAELERNCAEFGVNCHGPRSPLQGIVHVVGPELGLTRPGMTIVCGDSHTATHGAFGALAFGIGTSEVEMVLASQCLLQMRPRTFRVTVNGARPPGVSAKDLILTVITRIGAAGGTGFVLEYAGSAIRALSMEERMTVCNMSIEAGARAGLIAPDEVTFAYLRERPCMADDSRWDANVAGWRALTTDEDARFDREIEIDACGMAPMITFGTTPAMAIPVTGVVPDPADTHDAAARGALERALAYMRLEPGKPIAGHPVDEVFIGSCTNARLSDLRDAARVLDGRRVHPNVRVLVVPGSKTVKRAAEAECLDRIFMEAGAEWREPGCSMCIAMNGDVAEPGHAVVSTSNRNFEGRQGKGARTLLASPATAAASAVLGCVADARRL